MKIQIQMKMKMKILLIILITSLSAQAKVGLKFNNLGVFIPPDEILQQRGVEEYRQGHLDSSISNLKRSVRLGNDMSKYILALIYLEKEQWTTGHAWLNFVNHPIDDRNQLIKKFNSQLSKEELKVAAAKTMRLKKLYSNESIYNRRIKWQKTITFTGSHIPGIKTAAAKSLRIDAGSLDGGLLGKNINNTGANISSSGIFSNNITNVLSRTVKDYILEYSPKENIIMGEIIEQDSD
jgi:hypothetical protein